MIKFQKIKEDITKYFSQLPGVFEADSDIVSVYLFGSYASGNVGPLSDVDIAVLLTEKIPPQDYFDRQLELLGSICRVLHTDEVDLVVLNQAPLLFRYSIIKSGKVLYCADERKRIDFELFTLLTYMDTKKLRDEYFLYLKKRIREGTHGAKLASYRDAFRKAARVFGGT